MKWPNLMVKVLIIKALTVTRYLASIYLFWPPSRGAQWQNHPANPWIWTHNLLISRAPVLCYKIFVSMAVRNNGAGQQGLAERRWSGLSAAVYLACFDRRHGSKRRSPGEASRSHSLCLLPHFLIPVLHGQRAFRQPPSYGFSELILGPPAVLLCPPLPVITLHTLWVSLSLTWPLPCCSSPSSVLWQPSCDWIPRVCHFLGPPSKPFQPPLPQYLLLTSSSPPPFLLPQLCCCAASQEPAVSLVICRNRHPRSCPCVCVPVCVRLM